MGEVDYGKGRDLSVIWEFRNTHPGEHSLGYGIKIFP